MGNPERTASKATDAVLRQEIGRALIDRNLARTVDLIHQSIAALKK
jgi:hypothetical protein